MFATNFVEAGFGVASAYIITGFIIFVSTFF
jgi:hypothetical protein